jgi:glycosyltransferase involved in cell wall biosynthesis
MRFCMVSTFYPPYHFGGDAIYIQRLSQALARRGHTIDVLHDRDAYYLTRREEPRATADVHPNVRVHSMKSRFGFLSPLLTQQTARPWLKPEVRRHLESGRYDVIHFHNPSLIGSTALAYGTAVKLYTLHEHWLICPMHVLWKRDREACDRPECLKCCLHARRPPQLWRYTGRLARDLRHIDRFIAPSRFTRDRHRQAGLDLPMSVLPHFVPAADADAVGPPHARPYFLFVGRLVRPKGVDTLLRVFRRYRDADLLIVGDGDQAGALRAMAADLPHVRFLGATDQRDLRALYRHAIALVMPSVGYEVFGIVLLEAFAARTPVIVRDLGGAAELVEDSSGGLLFRSDDELASALARLQAAPELARALGEAGYRAYLATWSEAPHLDAYLAMVRQEQERKAARASDPGGAPGAGYQHASGMSVQAD